MNQIKFVGGIPQKELDEAIREIREVNKVPLSQYLAEAKQQATQRQDFEQAATHLAQILEASSAYRDALQHLVKHAKRAVHDDTPYLEAAINRAERVLTQFGD